MKINYNEISKQYTAQDFLELPDVYMKFDTYLSIYNNDVNNNHATFWAFLKDLYKSDLKIQQRYATDKTFVDKMLVMNFLVKYADSNKIHEVLEPNAIRLVTTNDDIKLLCKYTSLLAHLEGKYTVNDIRRVVEFVHSEIDSINGYDAMMDVYSNKVNTYKTGFNQIDRMLGNGVEFGSLVVLSGSNGSGKSNLVHQLFINNAVKQRNLMDYRPAIFSGELSNQMLTTWIAQTFTNKDDLELYNEVFYRPKYEIFTNKLMPLMSGFDIMNLKGNNTLSNLLSNMYNQLIKGSKIFIIDNLMKIDDSERDILQKQKKIVNSLKTFAQTHNVIVVLVAHNNKPPRGVSQKANKNDISGSANISDLADYVFMLDRKEDSDELKNLAILSLVKNRPYGFTGEVGLVFIPKRRRYLTLSVDFNKDINDYSFRKDTLNRGKLFDSYY